MTGNDHPFIFAVAAVVARVQGSCRDAKVVCQQPGCDAMTLEAGHLLTDEFTSGDQVLLIGGTERHPLIKV